jgi:hypothetical protein
MVWIGGAPGAGKSTIARDLARRSDLPLHPIDLWTYDRVGRMPPLRPLAEDLAKGPEFAAEAFVKIAWARLEMVAADVRARALGDVPALVEGPQLFPSMADEVAGAALRQQREYGNLVACRQGRLWQADIGLAEPPPYPFACECGRSGCSATWPGTPDEYHVRRADGAVTVR